MKSRLAFKLGSYLGCLILLLQTTSIYGNCLKKFVFVRHGEKNQPAFGQINCQGLNRALALPGVLQAKFGTPFAIFAPNPAVTVNESCGRTGCCFYNRPQQTISPTAINFSVPIDENFGIGNVGGPIPPTLPTVINCMVAPATPNWALPQAPSKVSGVCGRERSSGDYDLARKLVENSNFCGKTVFIAWEHTNIPAVVYDMYSILGVNAFNQIPLWPYGTCQDTICTPNTCEQTYNFDTIYIVDIDQKPNSRSVINITLDQEGLNGQSDVCP